MAQYWPAHVAIEIYDQLLPFTREDIMLADARWAQFNAFKTTVGTHRFPIPTDFYAHQDHKVAWVQAHSQELQPLLDWWMSKNQTSSEVSYEREQRSAVG